MILINNILMALNNIYNCFTLGEILVIVIAIIILAYYVYSVKCSKNNNELETSEDEEIIEKLILKTTN